MGSTSNVKTLQLPNYDLFKTITRYCHWDTYIQENKIKMLTHVSHDSNVKLKNHVIYFAPSTPAEDYNKHGNLSYFIDWDLVIERLGPNMYLLDQTIDTIQGHTSVLLTSNDYDKKLEKISLVTKGSPIIRSGGRFYHASSCLCKERLGTHEVVIVIESKRSADAKWLFRNSDVRANDHSLANIPFAGFSRCVKYNTICKMLCPFPWTFHQTQQMIRTVNPELTFIVDCIDQLPDGIEPQNAMNQNGNMNTEKEEDGQNNEGMEEEEMSNALQENETNIDNPDSSNIMARQGSEPFDANHWHNCAVMLIALGLVNIRYILNNELMMQLIMLALVIALKYYILPVIWPQYIGTPVREDEEESSDELDCTEYDSDQFSDSEEVIPSSDSCKS